MKVLPRATKRCTAFYTMKKAARKSEASYPNRIGIDNAQSRIGCKCKKATCLVKFCECVQSRTNCDLFCKCYSCDYRPNVITVSNVVPRNDSPTLDSSGRRPSFAIRRISKRISTEKLESKTNPISDDSASADIKSRTNKATFPSGESVSADQCNTPIHLQEVCREKKEFEEKVLALQDEHMWINTRLLSTQSELSANIDASETRLCLEKQKAKHEIDKLQSDWDTTKQDSEARIDNLVLSFSNEIQGVKKEKEDIENKLAIIQDEHVWTSVQLSSLQNELQTYKDTYETRLAQQKQKSKHKIDLLEKDKANAIAKAIEFEADIDTTIQVYEAQIGDITTSYSNKIEKIKNEKASVEISLKTLHEKHAKNNQILVSAQEELSANKIVHEKQVKLLECKLKHATDQLQQKINALEKELVSMKAYQSYSNPVFSRSTFAPTTSSSVTIQDTSDEVSIDSDVVAVVSNGGSERNITSHIVKTSATEFVNMDVFDGSSLSSACSSTSYDA